MTNMAKDIEPADIADDVYNWLPYGSKVEMATEFLRLVDAHDSPSLRGFVHDRLIQSIGKYMSEHVAGVRKREQNERLESRGIPRGAAVGSVMSIRRKGAPTAMLWTDATPREFLDAVRTEQNVVDGRNRTNRVRMQLAEQMAQDPSLMDMPTLGSVCAALDVDPDLLGLEDLAAS